MQLVTIILAAGKGTRMRSTLPKVLHKVAGMPMLEHVIAAARGIGGTGTIVVLNPDTDKFQGLCAASPDLGFAIQLEQRGTADAVASAGVLLEGETLPDYCRAKRFAGKTVPKAQASHILICAGDVPCLSSKTLQEFSQKFVASGAAFGVLGVVVPNPTGYGRLVLDKGKRLLKIVEERDASPAQRKNTLINSGVIIAQRRAFFDILKEVTPQNQQGEYYLTTIFELALRKRLRNFVYVAPDWREFEGINDRVQLAAAEEYLVNQKRRALQLSGVTLALPQTIYLDVSVEVGSDTSLGSGVVLLGATTLGTGCLIGSHSTLEDCQVSNEADIGAGSFLRNCRIKAGEVIPPLTCRLE